MSYSFDIVGVSPILTFFNHQQKVDTNPHRSKTYLGSYLCTLDAFIQSADLIPQKPDWDWEEVMQSMVNFWLRHEDRIRYWQDQLEQADSESLLIGRVANVEALRSEFESLVHR